MGEVEDQQIIEQDDRLAGMVFARLVSIMRRLRAPDGCPWDLDQDFSSLRRYMLEEAYEVVQAIDDGDPQALSIELGDLLLQIVFLSQISAEEGSFTVMDVVEALNDKLVRRHPHVFGDIRVDDSAAVVANWEAIKCEERGTGSLLDDVPRALPALERAQKLGRRAAQMSFDWASVSEVVGKVREELDELVHVLGEDDVPGVEDELGDLLLTLASLARHLGYSAEVALNDANSKFERRFRQVEAMFSDEKIPATRENLKAEWERVKAREDTG